MSEDPVMVEMRLLFDLNSSCSSESIVLHWQLFGTELDLAWQHLQVHLQRCLILQD
jgi:hypothetical protein